MNKEIFIDIQGYEGYYQINLNQEVRSLDRYIKKANGKNENRKGRVLKPIKDNRGYFMLGLSVGGKVKRYSLHRLMALTFIKNIENKPHINHKNGVKTDNSVENLEWCTAAENNRHAWKTGLNKPLFAEKHHLYGKKGPNAGKYGEQLKQTKIILDTQTGAFYYGAREAAEAKGINLNNLRGKLAGFIRNNTGLIYV